MFGRNGRRSLLIMVILLAGTWWSVDRYGTNSRRSTFDARPISVDTTTVRAFTIVPALRRHETPIDLTLAKGNWSVTCAGRTAPADTVAMRELFRSLAYAPAIRVAGKRAVVMNAYDLGDSTMDRLRYEDRNGHHELFVGAASGEEEGSTAIVRDGDEQVYIVRGDLGLLMDRSIIGWIPKRLFNGGFSSWTRVTFTFPSDSGYTIERSGQEWSIAGHPCDRSRVEKYFRNLSHYEGHGLVPPTDTAGAEPAFRIVIEDSLLSSTMVATVFERSGPFLITSTFNPGVVVAMDPQQDLIRLFRPRTAFFREH